ncbi:T9SS type A sorting domain-containing protein [Calditrichota bacterium]
MLRIATVLLLLISTLSFAEYDPPEVLATFSHDSLRSPYPFLCIEDQNDDGYDDFIFSSQGRILLYNGDIEVSKQPSFFINTPVDRGSYGSSLAFTGNLSDSITKSFAVRGYKDIDDERYYYIDLFAGSAELDTIREHTFSGNRTSYFSLSYDKYSKPYDLNNDGWDDLILSEIRGGYKYLTLFYGGEEFNTAPDWRYNTGYRVELSGDVQISGGFDINGDGYDDVLIRYGYYPSDQPYMIFLGGETMSDEPYLRYDEYIFEEGDDYYGRGFIFDFIMLQDVNNDGYDDWAHCWWYNLTESDGIFVFYGSEEPDLVPDLDLDGHATWIEEKMTLAGGDFNGDGIGDIVSAEWGANRYDGEMNVFFGSENMSGEADLRINTFDEYGYERMGLFLGAVGDYNGDGSDDFMSYFPSIGDRQQWGTIVLSGWKNNSVKTDPIPTQYDLSLTAYPNPFNASIDLTFTLETPAPTSLTIYDTNGRLLETLFTGKLSAGHHHQSWQADRSGVYFVRLQSGNTQAFRKIVALK